MQEEGDQGMSCLPSATVAKGNIFGLWAQHALPPLLSYAICALNIPFLISNFNKTKWKI